MHMLKQLLLLLPSIFSTFSCVSNIEYPRPTIIKDNLIRANIIIPVYIDKQLTDTQKSNISKAVIKLNEATGNQIGAEVVSTSFDMDLSLLEQAKTEKVWFFLAAKSTDPHIPQDKCGAATICITEAWTNSIPGYYVKIVSDIIPDNEVEPDMFHEMGHLLGLEHVANPKSLMFKHHLKNNYSCLDKQSAQILAETYDLDFSKMKYC